MKAHEKFETAVPAEFVPVIQDDPSQGYRTLTDRKSASDDMLLSTSKGTALRPRSFGARVKRLSGKRFYACLFCRIVATRAAQV